jgi:hypothetical protein
MKLLHTSIFFFAGLLFTQALLAQAVTNLSPVAVAATNIVAQQVTAEAIEQPAASNATDVAMTDVAATDVDAEEEEEVKQTATVGIPFENSPYPIILEKMPFGSPPDPNALDAAATGMDEVKMKAEQEKLAQTFSWTAINITPDGQTAIGFTDLSVKPPASYYMTVGESANNWTVVEADYDSETATIEKDGVRISLKFGNKSPITPAQTGPSRQTTATHRTGGTPPAPQPVAEIHTASSPSNGRSSRTTHFGRSSFVSSYRDRLNARLKDEETQKQEKDRKQKEDLAKIVTDALRKQQEEAAAAAAAAAAAEQEQQAELQAP